MATDANQNDIFQSIRNTVGQTLEMAEAESKVSAETQDLLSQLILTRRGDGEIVLDVSALQRMKAADNQWTNKERNEQDRLVNPTRLPQLVPGLQGLQSSQYLAFVQRPLERNGDNCTFLEAAALRISNQYQAKELAAERNRLFGRFQRYVAKIVMDEILTKKYNITDSAKLDELRNATPPQKQFTMAGELLEISTTEVLERLYKYAVALTLIERIKAKAIKVKKSQPSFEKSLRQLAGNNAGAASKNRIKDIFMGFHKDLEVMTKEFASLPKELSPILKKMHRDQFGTSYTSLHRHAARLDAIASRWLIIINEAEHQSPASIVEKIKGMHKCFTD